MTLNAIFYVFAAVLYLAAAFGIYKTLQEPEPTEKFWIRPLIFAGLMIQAYLIYEALFLYGTPHFGMALALTITLFTCTFLLLLESFFSKIGAMLVFVLPLSAVSMLLPLLLPGSPLAPETASGPFRLHLLLAILAYSVMTMALIQGLLLMAVHKRVRAKDFVTHEGAKHVNILDNMPSMMEMEKILFRLIWVGFIVLTAAILFGAVYSQELFGQAFRFDHKTVTTCMAWVIFGILLLGHHLRGWRGKFAALWTVIGFCVLMVSYIGVRFVMEVVPGA
ncbi:cytochrome C assembly family protein [Parasutterella sp.]|uniref:cytochrome C assembly family protein n=1 Tax=Parasutterella sp. TaxID=2049037 RepID=UPI003AB3B514